MKSSVGFLLAFYWVIANAASFADDFLTARDQIPANDYAALNELQENYLSKFNHLVSMCGTEEDYINLVTLGFLIEGTHPIEQFSEIASKATMHCPDMVLNALAEHHGEPVVNFVGALGIRIAPWVVAESIYPELLKYEHRKVYDEYFKPWIHNCVDANGEAIVGCGQ